MRPFALLACVFLAGCSRTDTDQFRIRLEAFLDEASTAAVMIERASNSHLCAAQGNAVEKASSALPEKEGTERIRESASQLSDLVIEGARSVDVKVRDDAAVAKYPDIPAQMERDNPPAYRKYLEAQERPREVARAIRQQVAAIRKMAKLP